jgi:hypothetical protein
MEKTTSSPPTAFDRPPNLLLPQPPPPGFDAASKSPQSPGKRAPGSPLAPTRLPSVSPRTAAFLALRSAPSPPPPEPPASHAHIPPPEPPEPPAHMDIDAAPPLVSALPAAVSARRSYFFS